MSIFSNFKNEDVKIEETKEVISQGRTFGILETNVYEFTILKAYVTESSGGAMAFNFELESVDKEVLTTTIYVSSGKAKGQKNYYVDKNGKNQFLPGYSLVNDICILAAETALGPDLETEDLMVELYDYKLGKKVPTQVPVATELLNQKVKLAVEKQLVDKNVSDGNGNWVPSGETREQNEVVKAFSVDDDTTVQEAKANKESAYMAKWLSNNKGNVRNKSTGEVKVAPQAQAATVVNNTTDTADQPEDDNPFM